MSPSIVNQRTTTDALLTLLGGLSFPIGDGISPVPAGDKFAVVYSLNDEGTDGPANDTDADVQHTYQVTAVGATRYQAEWVADECRKQILGGTLTISGRAVMRVVPASSGPIERDDDLPTPLFYSVSTFQIWTTPGPYFETITEPVGVTDVVTPVSA